MKAWTKAIIVYNLSIIAFTMISENVLLGIVAGAIFGTVTVLIEEDS